MCLQSLPLKMKYQLFSIAAEFPVPEVALYGIKLADEPFDIFSPRTDRKKRGWCFDEESGPFRKATDCSFWVKHCRVSRDITLDRINDCRLKVLRGKISLDRLRPKSVKDRRYIAVLKFNGCFGPIDLASQDAIMLGLVEGDSDSLIAKHGKIVDDYEIKFLTSPISTLAWIVRQRQDATCFALVANKW